MAKKSSGGYTLGTFIFDVIMCCCTCGLWLAYRLFKILSSK